MTPEWVTLLCPVFNQEQPLVAGHCLSLLAQLCNAVEALATDLKIRIFLPDFFFYPHSQGSWPGIYVWKDSRVPHGTNPQS